VVRASDERLKLALLDRPGAPDEWYVWVLAEASEALQHQILQRARARMRVLHHLVLSRSARIRLEIANLPRLSREAALHLARDPVWPVREAIARRGHLSPKRHQALLEDPVSWVRLAAAGQSAWWPWTRARRQQELDAALASAQ
jgi:hypothetical protein